MMYQIETRVFSGEKLIDRNITFEGKEPIRTRCAIEAYVKIIGQVSKPDIYWDEINRFTMSFVIRDTVLDIANEKEEDIELTIYVTVHPRLTLD